MKTAIALVVIIVVGVVLFVAFRRKATAVNLTSSEAKILDLIREVYGENIVSEHIVRNGPDKVLVAELRNEKLQELRVNLSSLARKHEEGVSLPVLKMGLRFD